LIYGIGTDIIEVYRIEKSISKNKALKQKLFTGSEQKYCESKKAVTFQCYAARFAAKEAFFKALGTGYRYGLKFNEIEIINDELGKPTINPLGKTKEFIVKNKIKAIHLSLSHVKATATAVVILEK
jgi:holo-[acyl-carrier protein] synthase